MIQQETRVIVADNSGAKTAKVLKILKWSRARFATVWDKVVVAVRTVNSHWNVDKGSVHWWVVIRVKKEVRRNDGSYIRFNENAIALISNETEEPLWKRIFWPVAREVREKWYRALSTMGDEIV